MNILLKTLATSFAFALVVFGFAGCGSANTSSGGGGSQPQQAALVTGSWSGKGVSSQTGPLSVGIFVANIQSQGAGSYFSTPLQTMVCGSTATCMSAFASTGTACQEIPNYSLTETVIGHQVTGSITGAGYSQNTVDETISFTGTLSQDGKSIAGTYTYTTTSGQSDSGTLQMSVNSGATGTYSGQVTSQSSSSNYPITLALTQNSDGSVTGNGVLSNSSCISSFTVNNSSPDPSFAFGGAFHIDANSDQLSVDGIPNGDGTYAISFWLPQTSSCTADGGNGSATKH